MTHSSKLSSLLALSLMLFAVIACSSSSETSSTSSSSNSTTTSSPAAEASTEFKIDTAEMRKDDGTGKFSDEVVNTFSQSDKKIHCYIDWDNPKTGTKIKFVFIAVDAGGAKNETIKEFSMVTENELQNEAHGSLVPNKPFPKGSYKVDVYVNDQLARTVPFKIS
jgi:uncharacterized protein YcfL